MHVLINHIEFKNILSTLHHRLCADNSRAYCGLTYTCDAHGREMCAHRNCMSDKNVTVTGVTCPRDSGDWYVCGITQWWIKRMACIQHLENF